MTSPEKIKLDGIDLAVLHEIQKDSRISNSELARRINLSQPAAHARLKRLKKLGVIKQYVSLLDHEKLGLEFICFFQARLQAHSAEVLTRFEEELCRFPEVLECHYLTGESDYLIKAIFRSQHELEQFLRSKLTTLPHVRQITTSLVLSEIKATTMLPLPGI
ncbi:MAG: Lrp/AsnC family transcriptional regulator [Desulfuromusa sp.]